MKQILKFKNSIVFVTTLFFTSGCTTKIPTFTNTHPESSHEWNSNAYYEWLKG